jgi:transcriptional regulator with AAA-type ATPase domain
LEIPGLNKRRDDIPYLAEHFVRILLAQMNMPKREASRYVMAVLQSHNWPGNVRQLRNCIEYMMLSAHAADSKGLSIDHLPREILSDADVAEDVGVSRRIMSLPLRGSVFSAIIWSRRLRVFLEISRERQVSWVWSIRHFIARLNLLEIPVVIMLKAFHSD